MTGISDTLPRPKIWNFKAQNIRFSITALIRFRCLIKVCTSNNVLSQAARQQAVITSDSTSPSCCYELSVSVWFSHKALEREKFCEELALKKSNCCVLQMGRWEESLVAGSKLRANRKFPITPELTDYWQHQKQLGPPTSHVSFSEERVGLASWHTNKHTYIWGPYRFVLRRHRASFPACLPSVHPLSLHYSTTDPLMVNISDTDAAEKCWQHKSLSAGNWTRREICSASSHTEAE